jgi:hypothetical protein
LSLRQHRRGREQHRAATHADGQRPRAVEPTAVALEGFDQRLGLVETAKTGHRLDGLIREYLLVPSVDEAHGHGPPEQHVACRL